MAKVFGSALSNKRDSENEHSVEEDDEDDSLTFMRTVTTRRGRAVRVKFFFIGSYTLFYKMVLT